MVGNFDSIFSLSRTAGLFSLIDTMWPPVVPLKAPGHGHAYEEVSPAAEDLPLASPCSVPGAQTGTNLQSTSLRSLGPGPLSYCAALAVAAAPVGPLYILLEANL